MFSKALNHDEHFLKKISSFCVFRGLSHSYLSASTLMTHENAFLISAVRIKSKELNIFQRVPPFFSLWGITSIKITGLQDQRLLGVLFFLLAASFFTA